MPGDLLCNNHFYCHSAEIFFVAQQNADNKKAVSNITSWKE
jgi:hypothetical protein